MRQYPAFADTRAAVLLLVGAAVIGLAVSWQGWRERGPDADVIASMVRASALVDRGTVPRRGNLTDLASFRPPGLSWLLVPSVAVLRDPRRIELASCALLYLGTIAGVFALAQLVAGGRAAPIAALLYCWSGVAIYFGHTMQPKAYPLFGAWMLYCVVRWVATRRGRWFAAACIVCAAGMYVHVEMIVLASAIPIAWLISRAPIGTRAVAVAVFGIALMWWPYLDFQRDRHFVDLESQLLLRHIGHRGPETVPWCGEDPLPNPTFVETESDHLPFGARVRAIPALALMNFETRIPGGAIAAFLVFAIGAVVWIHGAGAPHPEPGRTLALAAVVPMLALVLLTEPGVPRQQMLWPLQVVIIAGVLDRAHGPRQVAAILAVLLIVATNAQVTTRLRHWVAGGWSGAEPAIVEAAEFRSARCEDER